MTFRQDGVAAFGTHIASWWLQSGFSVLEISLSTSRAGSSCQQPPNDHRVVRIIVTQIHNDGMGGGADVDGLTRVLAATTLGVIASGGVGSLDDISALADVETEGRRLLGVIVGKAIHDGVISVADAIAATRAAS